MIINLQLNDEEINLIRSALITCAKLDNVNEGQMNYILAVSAKINQQAVAQANGQPNQSEIITEEE
jgi:hypothetical protein